MNKKNLFNSREIQLINTFRQLWEQHIMWTRSFILSFADNDPDLENVKNRLLRNPQDFANVLSPFLGRVKTDRFKNLFEEHLLIAAQLISDAKEGKSNAVETDRRKWYDNADKIAMYLSRLNPKWDENVWRQMLYNHLEMTENEAVQRLNGNYTEDIMEYDKIEQQALDMADYMSMGIINQFRI